MEIDFVAVTESSQYFPINVFLLTKNKEININKALKEQERERDMEERLFKKVEENTSQLIS